MGPSPYLVDGAHALSMGDYYEAIRHTQRGLDEPIGAIHRSAALSNLCAGFDAIGEYEHALESCDAALAIDDGNWQAYGNRAIAHLRLGRLEAARADVQHALALNPTSSELLVVRSMLEKAEAPPSPRPGPGQEPIPE
jgi:tetratricopeptide (TPR) repeat protein